MAEFTFPCPSCSQQIACDDQWSGHQIQCPICQAALVVPARPAPGKGHDNPLVPKPPAGGGRLAVSGHGAQRPAETGVRNIPVRNLAPEAQKKRSPLVKILVMVVVVAALAVGGYYGFQWLMKVQNKSNAQRAKDESSEGGQVAHIDALNQVLDATEPGGAGLGSIGRSKESRSSSGRRASDSAATEGADAAPVVEKPLPVIPPVYNLEVASAKIPEGKVNGTLSGTNFLPETIRLDATPTAQVLQFTEGSPASPERQIFIYLHPKPGEQLAGKKLTIPKDSPRTSTTPTVTKRWKTDPRYAPRQQAYSTGFALSIEFGEPAEGVLPGKIYLALPDTEQSVIAGVFKATSNLASGAGGVQTAPTAAPAQVPGATPAERNAFQSRYGTKR